MHWLAALVSLTWLGSLSCQGRDRERDEPASGDVRRDPQLVAALAAKGASYRPYTRHLNGDGSPKFINRLILESSPYLLQHAHNPVDWYAWSDDAFAKAEREGKPILLSIGYSTCHWCHVMARESFEDEAIAAQLNRDYVAIKVDREQRPDLDGIYLAAVEQMTGSGGWPLTVILLPDRRPVFGGTYFAPRAFAAMLERVRSEIARDPAGAAARASIIVSELAKLGPVAGAAPGSELLATAASQYARVFDSAWGGFGRAPKFPQPAVLGLLLRHYRRTGDSSTLAMVVTTLERMASGGVHDQVGGGFHRYAVDDKWRIPHFEKMLYDNAQLAVVYLEAAQASGRGAFSDVARELLDFMLGELSEGGGFAAAIDADENYYTWPSHELAQAVGADDAATVREYFDATIGGNFERGRNVLWRPNGPHEVAERLGVTVDALMVTIARARTALRAARDRRPRPHLDRKVLVGWNGLAVSALARGALVLGDPRYLAAARTTAAGVLATARPGHLIGSDGAITGTAFLDDLAFAINGLLDLLEVDADPAWFAAAVRLASVLEADYRDPGGGYFFTPTNGERLLVRTKPSYDDATPAGNSAAAHALVRLSLLTGDARYRERATAIFSAFAANLTGAPTTLPAMVSAIDLADDAKQVVIVAPRDRPATALTAVLRDTFVPNRVVVQVRDGDPAIVPLVEDKRAIGAKPTAYVCLGSLCKHPTADPIVFAAQLRAAPK